MTCKCFQAAHLIVAAVLCRDTTLLLRRTRVARDGFEVQPELDGGKDEGRRTNGTAVDASRSGPRLIIACASNVRPVSIAPKAEVGFQGCHEAAHGQTTENSLVEIVSTTTVGLLDDCWMRKELAPPRGKRHPTLPALPRYKDGRTLSVCPYTSPGN